MSNIAQSPDDVVILGARRTPQGKLLGQLADLTAVDLGAAAIAAAVESAGVKPEDVQHVALGQVLLADAGQNPARQSAVKAGLPLSTGATTVNRVCLSGLDAVIQAARMIRAGEIDVAVGAGQESMTNAPHVVSGSRKGKAYGAMQMLDTLERDALVDAFNGDSMGVNTERGNAERGLTRTEQDEVAAQSHQRAAKAWEEGAFDAEIVEISIPQRKGDPIVVREDQGIRPQTTVESLSKLRPAFSKDADATITAGNSSPISDGAAALVLARRSWAEERGLEPLATVGFAAAVAGPDTSLHSQPSNAIKAALDRAGWTVDDLDFIEINEAFGSVAVQSLKDLDYPLEKTNIHGGAIALGHPVGASGCRLVVHAAQELARRGEGKAAVSLCGGGGQGDALLLFR